VDGGIELEQKKVSLLKKENFVLHNLLKVSQKFMIYDFFVATILKIRLKISICKVSIFYKNIGLRIVQGSN